MAGAHEYGNGGHGTYGPSRHNTTVPNTNNMDDRKNASLGPVNELKKWFAINGRITYPVRVSTKHGLGLG